MSSKNPMDTMNKLDRVVIVGATGLVGTALVRTLERFPFPVESIRLLATARSAGKRVSFRGQEYSVEEFDVSAFKEADLVLFAGKDGLSEEFCPIAASEGAWVIDNSAGFRMDDAVPLVVPEVNPHAIGRLPGIIANPNCSTIQLAVALAPLHKAYGLRRVIVSTYQSASGAGGEYLELLKEDSRKLLDEGEGAAGESALAFNCLPDVGSPSPDGRFSEEFKLERELRKILELPELRVSATAVRVPTFVGHAESVVIETEKPLDADGARRILSESPGIRVLDDFRNSTFPTPRQAAGTDEVWVGRIRRAGVFDSDLALWVVADNLLKGAALNAVQIALYLLERA